MSDRSFFDTNVLVYTDDASSLHRLHSISIWDALVVRAAQSARCRVLYTEDLQTGWRPEGLAVVNPFR